ncbi:hypothetical protein NMY22_g19577 [Coprinellus aureogranulatus]|nr:hypothetical protein NMY22_g19577 [Coprinellus aureogranulatus]
MVFIQRAMKTLKETLPLPSPPPPSVGYSPTTFPRPHSPRPPPTPSATRQSCAGMWRANTAKLAHPRRLSGMMRRTSTLESSIEKLEACVRMFKNQVDDITDSFRQLKSDIEEVNQEFETLENDHITALLSLEEEKNTVDHYIGQLRNSDVELKRLYNILPKHNPEVEACCMSQAKPDYIPDFKYY